MSRVIKTDMPILHNTPKNIDEFNKTLVEGKTAAYGWTNNVLAKLLNVPDAVRSYNGVITQIFSDALAQTETLSKDPSNKIALNILNNDLKNLSSQMGIISTYINGTVQSVSKFKSKLPEMADRLEKLADLSKKEKGVDQSQIEKFEKDIKKLNDEIASLTGEIIALGIADAAAIGIGTLGYFMPFPANVAIWAFAGIAIGAATTVIIVDGIKISQDQKQIEAYQTEIKGLTQDVTVLTTIANNFISLSNEVEKIQDNAQQVLDAWLLLEHDINNAISNICTAIADEQKRDFNKVAEDLREASKEWDESYKYANTLHLDLEANNAEIKIGMSPEEVKQAVADGKKVGIIEYLNAG